MFVDTTYGPRVYDIESQRYLTQTHTPRQRMRRSLGVAYQTAKHLAPVVLGSLIGDKRIALGPQDDTKVVKKPRVDIKKVRSKSGVMRSKVKSRGKKRKGMRKRKQVSRRRQVGKMLFKALKDTTFKSRKYCTETVGSVTDTTGSLRKYYVHGAFGGGEDVYAAIQSTIDTGTFFGTTAEDHSFVLKGGFSVYTYRNMGNNEVFCTPYLLIPRNDIPQAGSATMAARIGTMWQDGANELTNATGDALISYASQVITSQVQNHTPYDSVDVVRMFRITRLKPFSLKSGEQRSIKIRLPRWVTMNQFKDSSHNQDAAYAGMRRGVTRMLVTGFIGCLENFATPDKELPGLYKVAFIENKTIYFGSLSSNSHRGIVYGTHGVTAAGAATHMDVEENKETYEEV